MHRTLIASLVVLAVAGASTASAADLSNPPTPPTDFPQAAPITFDWTGAYLGLTAGYGFGRFPSSITPGVVTNSLGDASGFIGGVTAGYQMQFGQFVAGIEGEVNYGGFSDAFATTAPITGRADANTIGMLTGRLGFTPFDRFLLYTKGGYAFAFSEVSVTGVGSDRNFHNGWTLGTGLEYAVTQNVTTKIEYNYLDLERKNFNIGANTGSVGFQGHLLRAGLNYKF